jgi:hypothetical protein
MTTTDPFTTAAREEAHAFWMGTLQDDTVGVRDLGEHIARWARSYLAAQEPTDAECLAFFYAFEDLAAETNIEHIRAALSAARRAQTGNAPPALVQRISDLHTTDPDGNCGHCTRGRVYAVPAPCETVRALAGGGGGR